MNMLLEGAMGWEGREKRKGEERFHVIFDLDLRTECGGQGSAE